MPRRPSFPPPDLGLTRVREDGLLFETGRPVTFRYVHNDAKSPKLGALYGQDIEPSGFYIQHVPDTDSTLPRGWTAGMATLEHPLVLTESVDRDSLYGPTGWKARLFAATKKKRKALSRYLMSLGYDSIVSVRISTAGDEGTTEIVILRA